MVAAIVEGRLTEQRDTILNGPDVHVDDLIPLTNALQRADLIRIMEYTPYGRRPHVALAFLDMTLTQWFREAGLEFSTARHWISQHCPLPLGAAIRLARVLGLPVNDLFLGYGLDCPIAKSRDAA